MKEEIINNLNNPRQLEKLYRDNKATFKKEFNLIFTNIQDSPTAQIWNERLNFEDEEISWGTNNELIFVIVVSFIAGLIAKIPAFTAITYDFFYPRNTAFVVFPLLAAYFSWRQSMQLKKVIAISAAILISAVYINVLPGNSKSDTLILACIHLPLFLWAVLGYTFVGNNLKSYHKRLDFLRYNGDLLVMTAIILIAGAILTGITIGLFSLIKIEIREFYLEYIVVWGLAAAPIVGTYLVQTNPQLVNKVSPVIAKVFTPLVLATLVIYLIAVIGTGKDPYNDREFLLIFNLLLIGVMAIILFSVAETSKHSDSKIGILLLFGLSVVTIIVNGIALSAILFRISEWGITPNRLAVLGGNVLILTNLFFVAYRLFKTTRDRNEIEMVEKSIAVFLPIYGVWTIIVTFIFPILFNFK
ncbi:MAG TPA: hypothetical protein VFN30_13545 [Chitinophagaceae bacterium]|nr:hypothetical protein [Chitinophagaceae bacterium]